MSEIIEVLTPVGRIVAGHPMVARVEKDNRTGAVIKNQDGTDRTTHYFALAIAKQGEQHWNQTEWGAKIYAAGQKGWPNGEYNAPTFSWKVIDGDSNVPNKKGKKPCDREGWAGHWVVQLSTMLPIGCYHVGKLSPHEQIQNQNEIKAGDYGRVFLTTKGNAPSESPGVYLNPQLFELVRAGQQIVTDSGPAAADVFNQPAELPPGAAVDTAVQQPSPTPTPAAPTPGPAAPTQPNHDFLNAPAPQPQAEQRYEVGGQVYTESQLKAANWTEQQIATQAKPV